VAHEVAELQTVPLREVLLMELLQIIGEHQDDPPAPQDLVVLLQKPDERGLEVPLGDALKAVVVCSRYGAHARTFQTIVESPFFPGLSVML